MGNEQHPLFTRVTLYECDGCGLTHHSREEAEDHSAACPTIHPPTETPPRGVPTEDGTIALTRNSCVAHLYGSCPHVWQGDPVPTKIQSLETAWEVDVERRGGVDQLRWCTDCLSRYRNEVDG